MTGYRAEEMVGGGQDAAWIDPDVRVVQEDSG